MYVFHSPSFTNIKYKTINHVHKNMSVWPKEEALVNEIMVRKR